VDTAAVLQALDGITSEAGGGDVPQTEIDDAVQRARSFLDDLEPRTTRRRAVLCKLRDRQLELIEELPPSLRAKVSGLGRNDQEATLRELFGKPDELGDHKPAPCCRAGCGDCLWAIDRSAAEPRVSLTGGEGPLSRATEELEKVLPSRFISPPKNNMIAWRRAQRLTVALENGDPLD
jgi:hypothetical protein